MAESSDDLGGETSEAAPLANVRSPQRVLSGKMKTRLWWLTGLCGLLALGLVVTSFQSQGTLISIHFEEGHGLKAGDTLRYRGIDVGAVQSVKIAKAHDAVDVDVLLTPGHETIAVEGSQFWIERPRLRLGQVAGLDTVLGAKYVGVIPGRPDGPRIDEFQGLETPLTIQTGDSLRIRIHFPAGEGLAVGDSVQYRGIAVGEVTHVELSELADSVTVEVRLVGAARELARAGTQFWVERPRLDLTEVRGLDTLLGGRYIAMQPSLPQRKDTAISNVADATDDSLALERSPQQTEFVGLAEPPPLPRRDGSLEIELDSASRLGLVRGAPITYRGLEVGRVTGVGLSNDGATVKVRVVVEPEYAGLVRDNSKWWAIGGIKVDANLRGVHVAVESLSAWIRGGIAFATPVSPGEKVVTGHRFVLEPEPQAEWLEWQPRIVTGQERPGLALPEAVRVVASWQGSILGLYRRRTAEAWGVCLEGGIVRVPTRFLESATEASEELTIEVAGKSVVLLPETITRDGLTSRVMLPPDAQVTRWPSDQRGEWKPDSVVLIVNPELSEPMPLDATRVTWDNDQGLVIASGLAISESLEGSPVVDSETGLLIGMLVRNEESWIVTRLP